MVDSEPLPPDGVETPDDEASAPHHRITDPLTILAEAALEAERMTGHREETDAEAQRHVVLRVLRAFVGFVVIGVGIGGLVLPGPGWLLIIIGLSMLPFAWAERTVLLIRRKVPGIPEEGGIPLISWIIIGVVLAASIAISVLFGDAISSWVAGLWGDPDRLLGAPPG